MARLAIGVNLMDDFALADAGADPLAHAQDLQRERCLLFVAYTRSRDHPYVS